MKLLCNMGISPKTVAFLRSQGHEAKRLLEENLERIADANILDKARLEQSIVVTSDLDFGELRAACRAQFAKRDNFPIGRHERDERQSLFAQDCRRIFTGFGRRRDL